MIDKIKKWLSMDNENPEQRVLGLNGNFGSGKTTFIRNENILKEIVPNKETNIIYMNLLEMDFNENFISNLLNISSLDINKIEDKEGKKIWLNFRKGIINGTLNKISGGFFNGDLLEKDYKKENIIKIKKELDESILILDDLERINPENILKALSFINKLRWNLKNMKIIVPYNLDFINGILKNYLGDIYNSNYINKYIGYNIDFENKLSEKIKYISNIPELEILKSSILWDDMDFKINWRDLLNFITYIKMNNIKEMDLYLIFMFDKDSMKYISDENRKNFLPKFNIKEYLESKNYLELELYVKWIDLTKVIYFFKELHI